MATQALVQQVQTIRNTAQRMAFVPRKGRLVGPSAVLPAANT